MEAPCYNCKDRTVECHGTCDKYKDFKKEIEGYRKAEDDRKLGGYMFEAIDRMKKCKR
jgi:hypothetical protein